MVGGGGVLARARGCIKKSEFQEGLSQQVVTANHKPMTSSQGGRVGGRLWWWGEWLGGCEGRWVRAGASGGCECGCGWVGGGGAAGGGRVAVAVDGVGRIANQPARTWDGMGRQT